MLPGNPNSSHIEINATNISKQTTPSLLELAEQVAAAATEIAKQLREKNVTEPRFHPPCPGLPDDPEINEARQQLLVASRALGVLSHDPLSHLRETILQFNECAALVLVVDWKIAHILELDGMPMHISEIAKRAGAAADEYKLVSALRILTTQYIFAELKPGYFAHNSSSVYLAREETELLVGHCNEVLVPSTFKVSEAMRKWPASTKPTETAFAIGHKTSSPYFPWLLEHPAMITRFNKIMRVMAENSYARLRSVYPWRSLGKSTIVDLGGGNGHISHQIAYEAPELRFVLADLENAVKDAKKTCPVDLRDRFEYCVMDFFERMTIPADVYFMRMILHFMSDEDCVRVVKNIVPAMKKGSRILVADGIIPRCDVMPDPKHRYVFNQNWTMIQIMNARERTFADVQKIFAQADPRFRLKQWGEAGGPPSSEIIEAVLVDEPEVKWKL
ncbi:S-adenosyl-L-methionine-dependent methyltransferase [Morchella snyderi]|nr:S-adenosyl-L-methionine-dependent methyltransferase [Morchella snyderi]